MTINFEQEATDLQKEGWHREKISFVKFADFLKCSVNANT
jgi:hypothetical protein